MTSFDFDMDISFGKQPSERVNENDKQSVRSGYWLLILWNPSLRNGLWKKDIDMIMLYISGARLLQSDFWRGCLRQAGKVLVVNMEFQCNTHRWVLIIVPALSVSCWSVMQYVLYSTRHVYLAMSVPCTRAIADKRLTPTRAILIGLNNKQHKTNVENSFQLLKFDRAFYLTSIEMTGPSGSR